MNQGKRVIEYIKRFGEIVHCMRYSFPKGSEVDE